MQEEVAKPKTFTERTPGQDQITGKKRDGLREGICGKETAGR